MKPGKLHRLCRNLPVHKLKFLRRTDPDYYTVNSKYPYPKFHILNPETGEGHCSNSQKKSMAPTCWGYLKPTSVAPQITEVCENCLQSYMKRRKETMSDVEVIVNGVEYEPVKPVKRPEGEVVIIDAVFTRQFKDKTQIDVRIKPLSFRDSSVLTPLKPGMKIRIIVEE